MSFTPGPYWRQQEGEAAEKQQSIDQARGRRALLDHAKGDGLVSSPRCVGDRLRRMFSRGASPATSVEPDLSHCAVRCSASVSVSDRHTSSGARITLLGSALVGVPARQLRHGGLDVLVQVGTGPEITGRATLP